MKRLLLLLLMLLLVGVGLGPTALTLSGLLTGHADPITTLILLDIRLPRTLTSLGVGAALGLSGALLQGLLRNPLADPGVLGVSASASLGAVVALHFNLVLWGLWTVPVCAILAALLATALLMMLTGAQASTVRLILVGVGLSSLSGALIALAMNLAPNPFSLADLVSWLQGSVSNRSLTDLALAAPFWLLGLLATMRVAPALRALTLGESGAQAVGVDLASVRRWVIVGAALLTGTSVAIAGAIGFVGIVAPHLARALSGQDPTRALLPSALIGALMLGGADILIRLLPFDQELKLGVATALLGAPLFILIAARSRRVAA